MAKLKALHNHVIFQFIDELSDGGFKHFKESTEWGFKYQDRDVSMESARWVKVIAVGEDAEQSIKPGMEVLVEKLKWTNAVNFEGQKYWRTDLDCVLLIRES